MLAIQTVCNLLSKISDLDSFHYIRNASSLFGEYTDIAFETSSVGSSREDPIARPLYISIWSAVERVIAYMYVTFFKASPWTGILILKSDLDCAFTVK